MTKRTVIYMPGIGDRRTILNWLQQAFLASWLLYGFSSKLFVMDWKSSDSYADRFDALLALIDDLHAQGREVTVVGASAAASSVLLALMARPDVLIGAVTICGQIGGTASLHGPVAATHPRFKRSVALLQNTIAGMDSDLRGRVMTLRPRQDHIVPPHEAILSEATNYQMPLSGHMAGIGFGLLFEGYRIAQFLKSLPVSR